MNTKQWAVFLVALLSVDYATAGRYRSVPEPYGGGNNGYYGWSSGCRLNEDLTSSLDEALENARGHLGRYRSGYSLRDTNLEEYEFTGGNLRGMHRFERKGPYRCSLSRNYARVYFSIGFLQILVNYSISLAEDIFGGFFGGVASIIGRAIGTVANFLLRTVIPDVRVTCVLTQRFRGRRGFEVEGLYMNNIEDISFQSRRFSQHQDTFVSIFRPVFDLALRHFFQEEFSGLLSRYFSRVRAEKEMFYYESSSKKRRGNNGGQYEESDESSERYEDSYECSESCDE